MSFHFTFPRARVHRIGATWGITLSGTDAPRKTVFAQLHDAGTVAHEMVRLQRGTSPEQPGPLRPCPDCGRTTRPQKSGADKFPGTITRCDKAGRCNSCWAKHRKAAARQPDEPAVEPMTAVEVKAAMPAPRTPRPAPLKPVPAPVVTDVVKEATAAYVPPATMAVGPHYLKPDGWGEPACACGWDPYTEMSDIPDKSAAVTAVRLHLRKVRNAAAWEAMTEANR